MRTKTFTILSAVTGLAVVLAMAAILSQPGLESTDMEGGSILPNLVRDSERLKTVVIRQNGETISLDWDGKFWRAREKHNYLANSERVSNLLVTLAKMSKIEGKTRLPERYNRLEVEDPADKNARSRQVSLIDKDGKELGSVVLGKKQYNIGSQGNNTYVRLLGDPQVWLAAGEVEDSSFGVSDWLARDVANIPATAIARVTVTHANGEKVVSERPTPDATALAIQRLPKSAAAASDGTADEYARVLTALTLEDVAAASDKPFPKDSTITAVIDGLVGWQVIVELAEIDGVDWIKLKGTPPATGMSKPGDSKMVDLSTDWAKVMADLNARAEGWAFQVGAYQMAPLKKTMTDLLAKAPTDS